jgi:hypothetical protein
MSLLHRSVFVARFSHLWRECSPLFEKPGPYSNLILGNSVLGVGIMITHNPLHGSGRADFPHPALAFGNNAHAAQGIGMTDSRQRQPASDEAPHTSPEHATVLAAPRQRAMPEPSRLESKKSQRRSVHGHSVISEVSTHHRLQPFALFGNGLVHPSLKLGFHLVQLRLQPFADRPKATGALGGRGISRFPSEVPAYVHGVSDRAGLWHTSRYRCTRWSLPLSPTASASRRKFLTRLNTRPARSPYASTPPSRTAPHDSGPMRVAKPLSCDFFIHYNLAGLTGAQESNHGCEHG